MAKEVVFNLSESKSIKSEYDFDLIDLRYSVTNAANKLQVLVDLDLVTPKGLSLYKRFIGELVKDKELLSIKVKDFSLFWLTDCATKGYAWHWGRDFFLLIAILQENQSIFEKNYKRLTIYLPKGWSYLKATFSSFFSHLNYRIEFQFVEVLSKTKLNKSWLNTFRLNRKAFKIFHQVSRLKPKYVDESKNLFFHSFSHISSKDNLFNSLSELFEQNNKKIANIPYFWRCDGEMPKDFHRFKPTILQVVKLVFHLNRAHLKVLFFKGKSISLEEGLHFSTSFLKADLTRTLIGRSHLLFFYIWLTRYFSSINKLGHHNIFFDDEFYQTGKIISRAASNFSKVKSFGLQHGHFMETHTVYMITQAEIDAGLPKPSQFVSWGAYYNQKILKHNTLPESYVLPLGKPTYVLSQKNREVYPQLVKNVLWCLTTRECMEYEWKVIKEEVKSKPWKLKIRLHPLPHILKSEVVEILGSDVPFTFDNSSTIMKAIESNDLILVSAHSTTFLDSIVAKKYCIRLESRFWDGEKPIKTLGLYTVASDEQFKKAIKNVFKKTECEASPSFLELRASEWGSFIEKI